MNEQTQVPDSTAPPLISTALTFCVTHKAIGHESLAWNDCKFRQLFYFENPMDEHTVLWADEIGGAGSGQSREGRDG